MDQNKKDYLILLIKIKSENIEFGSELAEKLT